MIAMIVMMLFIRARMCSMTWQMVSRSDKISAQVLVPKTLRNEVATSKLVEWVSLPTLQTAASGLEI